MLSILQTTLYQYLLGVGLGIVPSWIGMVAGSVVQDTILKIVSVSLR